MHLSGQQKKKLKLLIKCHLELMITSRYFRGVGIKLVDFKIEYGRVWNKDKK